MRDLSHGIYPIDYTGQDSALSKKALGTQTSIMDTEITSTMADKFFSPSSPRISWDSCKVSLIKQGLADHEHFHGLLVTQLLHNGVTP